MAFSAILLFPKLAASAWESGSHLVSAVPDQAGGGDVLGLLASLARLFALALPVAGVALLAQAPGRLDGPQGVGLERRADAAPGPRARRRGRARRRCSPGPGGRPASTAPCARPTTARWWAPSGRSARRRPWPARAAWPRRARLSPGRHLAVALIPRGGPTEEHPALYVVNGGDDDDKPTILVSPDAPDARKAPTLDDPGAGRAGRGRPPPPGRGARRRDDRAVRGRAVHAHGAGDPAPVQAAGRAGRGRLAGARHQHQRRRHRLRRRLLARHRVRRRAGRQRELRLRARELRRLHDPGGLLPARPRGRAERPDHADQRRRGAQPRTARAASRPRSRSRSWSRSRPRPPRSCCAGSPRSSKKLDAIDTNDSPAEVLAQVNAVTDAIQRELDDSGITYPKATPTPAPAETPDAAESPDASATPGSAASPTPTPTPSPTATAAPTETATPVPTPTPTATRRRRRPPRRPRRRDAPGSCASARLPALLDLSG